jgi:phospholipid/cholesterol/gamma-HCH transport system permease protein
VVFLGDVVANLPPTMMSRKRMRWPEVRHIFEQAGANAVPIISLISFLVGLIIAFETSQPLAQFGAQIYVANMIGLIMVRELGPLLAAVLFAGRSGSAFAAEIGTMKVNEEIDAMETMALEPISFLVAPKFLAMLLMVPCLTAWADFMGVLGGGAFGLAAASFTWGSYIQATLEALLAHDIITGLLKAMLFGLVITAVGCQEGFSTGLGSEQVGRSTTSAVVKSIFMVVMVDLVSTTIFYLTAPR